jgi:hypothetical protein
MNPTDVQEPLMGLAVLMSMAYSGADLGPVGRQLAERIASDPTDTSAMMDISILLQFQGKRDLAMSLQAEALKIQQLYRLATPEEKVGIRMLALMGPGDLMSNAPLEFLVENSDIAMEMIYLLPDRAFPSPSELPEHDVAFIAISESDRNLPLLKRVSAYVSDWPRPVLNMPDRLALLSRNTSGGLLRSAPGLEMPVPVRADRSTLTSIADGTTPIESVLPDGSFPIVVRPVDTHAGVGLVKFDEPAGIIGYLQDRTEQLFYVSRFIDYRDGDGLFRKYRIVLIEGRPYLCHMGISEHWMVHYVSAGMRRSEAKRAEEARVMANFDEDFAVRHEQAFREINGRMGLDYLGIDCGETRDGKLLVFEVESSMGVHAMDSEEEFPYKKPQMRKVFAAFRTMLEHTAHGRGTGGGESMS